MNILTPSTCYLKEQVILFERQLHLLKLLPHLSLTSILAQILTDQSNKVPCYMKNFVLRQHFSIRTDQDRCYRLGCLTTVALCCIPNWREDRTRASIDSTAYNTKYFIHIFIVSQMFIGVNYFPSHRPSECQSVSIP